jgi:hypothetical protein
MYDYVQYGKNREKLESLLAKEKLTKDNNQFSVEIKDRKLSPSQEFKNSPQNSQNNQVSNGTTNPTKLPLIQQNQNFVSPTSSQHNLDLILLSKNKIFGWLGIPTKFDEMIYYARWWKFYDNCITIINLLIILLAFYDYELNFTYPRQIMADYSSVRLIMITLAILSIFCVYRRHFMKNKWKNIKVMDKIYIDDAYGMDSNSIENLLFEEDNLVIGDRKDKLLSPRFYFEVCLNLIMPIPGFDFHISVQELDRDSNKLKNVEYLLSDFFYLVVLLRSLYIIRAYINYSIFSDHYAYKICKEYKVQNNFRFAIKCLLKIFHIKLVLWFFFGSVCIFGFMLRIFERPFWVEKGRIEFDSYLTPMWCTFITMLTIGYGDFSPITTMGKLVAFIIGLWGVFISSLIIVCLHGLLDLSNDQFLVFTKILKSRVAVNFIESAYTFHKSKFLISKKNIQVTKGNYQDMLRNYYEFKNMRNESKSIYRSNGLLHYNMKLLKEMKKLNQRMDKLEIDIEAAKKKC